MPEVRQRNAAVPMRGHRLDQQVRDAATEILVDFYSPIAVAGLLLWTSIADRVRVKLGAGAYSVVGATRATAANLGNFNIGEVKQGTIEVEIPAGADTRREELELNLGYGVEPLVIFRTISGTINDSSGAGLDGVTINLTGAASDSTVTADGGAYEFTGLGIGFYTITPTLSGSTFLPASDIVQIIEDDEVAGTMAQVWQITGNIVDSFTADLPGVLVTLSGDASDTDTTDVNGDYAFTGLADGSYTVTPTKSGYIFDPVDSDETVSGDDETADFVGTDTTQQWPIAHNYAGDTLGDVIADIDARPTHFEHFSAGSSIQLDDAALWKAQDVGSPNIEKCWGGPGDTNNGGRIRWAAGEGFVPSDDGYFYMGMIGIVNGTNNRFGMQLMSEDEEEGLVWEMYGNSYNYVKTKTGGVYDASWKIGPYGLGRSTTSNYWWYWGIRYNFATNQCYARVIPLTASSPETDSGWVLIGTVSSPSFDQDIEMTRMYAYAGGGTTAPCAVGQVVISHYDVDGASDGNVLTHNYYVPT